MKRNSKKLELNRETLRSLRVLTEDEVARANGAGDLAVSRLACPASGNPFCR